MKKIQLLTATIGLTAAAGSYAIGYGSTTDAPTGARASELHAIQFTTEASDCPDISVCAGAASINSEFHSVIEITNQSTCTSPTGMCTPDTMVDSFAGAGGTATAGAAPADVLTQIFLPTCPVGAAPCLRDLILTTSFYDWNFTTDENGMIASGYFIADSTFATSGTAGVFIFPEKVARTYRGPASQLDVACAIDLTQDFASCWNDIPGTDADGPSTEQSFDYVTIPMGTDTGSGKAVPVPAFAAAGLGIGLIGVTILTARRRNVK